MTVNVSERLRDALERLDQMIDRLEVRVPEADGATAGEAPAPTADNAALSTRLDHMIARIETALAG